MSSARLTDLLSAIASAFTDMPCNRIVPLSFLHTWTIVYSTLS